MNTGSFEDGDGNGGGDDTGNGHAPEPTMMLLWALGSTCAFGFRHYRKRGGKA